MEIFDAIADAQIQEPTTRLAVQVKRLSNLGLVRSETVSTDRRRAPIARGYCLHKECLFWFFSDRRRLDGAMSCQTHVAYPHPSNRWRWRQQRCVSHARAAKVLSCTNDDPNSLARNQQKSRAFGRRSRLNLVEFPHCRRRRL